MSEKKQLNLFGFIAKQKTKKYIVYYKNPTSDYECYIERYCLHYLSGNPHAKKNDVVQQAQESWNSVKKDKEKILDYLILRNGEKSFVR